jgi:hypothetical protein
MVSLTLRLLNCNERKNLLLVLYVNRCTTLVSPNYCANCTGCLLGKELLTRLQLLHIVREIVRNLVIYVTRLLVINLLEHCARQVQIYSLFQTVLKLLPHLVLSCGCTNYLEQSARLC